MNNRQKRTTKRKKKQRKAVSNSQWKYKGLTRREAQIRAQKAWKTRYAKYGRPQRGRFYSEGESAKPLGGRFDKLFGRLKGDRTPIDDDDFTGSDFSEGYSSTAPRDLRNDLLLGRSYGRPGQTIMSTKMDRLAREHAGKGEKGPEEFVSSLKRELQLNRGQLTSNQIRDAETFIAASEARLSQLKERARVLRAQSPSAVPPDPSRERLSEDTKMGTAFYKGAVKLIKSPAYQGEPPFQKDPEGGPDKPKPKFVDVYETTRGRLSAIDTPGQTKVKASKSEQKGKKGARKKKPGAYLPAKDLDDLAEAIARHHTVPILAGKARRKYAAFPTIKSKEEVEEALAKTNLTASQKKVWRDKVKEQRAKKEKARVNAENLTRIEKDAEAVVYNRARQAAVKVNKIKAEREYEAELDRFRAKLLEAGLADLAKVEARGTPLRRTVMTAEDYYSGPQGFKKRLNEIASEPKRYIEGTKSIGFTDKGSPTADTKKAKFGIRANKVWDYEVRDKQGRVSRRALDFEDTTTKFKKGKRARFGDAVFPEGSLLPGEYDEVVSEHLRPRLRDSSKVRLRARGQSERENLLPSYYGRKAPRQGTEKDNEAEVEFRIPGIKKPGTRKKNPNLVDHLGESEGQFGKDYIIGSRVGFLKIADKTDPAFLDYVPMDTTGLAQEVLTAPLRAKREHELRDLSAKTWAARVTKADKVMARPKIVKNENFGPRMDASGFRPGSTYRVEGPKGHFPAHLMNDKQLRAKMEQVVDETYGPVESQDDREAKIKAATMAALGATYYGTSKRYREGTFPRAVNSLGAKISPSFSNVMKVKAAGLPLRDKIVDFGYMVAHPFDSPEGITMGANWGKWRDRPAGKFKSPDKAAASKLKKKQLELAQVGRVLKSQHKNVYSKNPIKRRYARYRKRDANKFKQFTEHESNIKSAFTEASEVVAKSVGKDKKHTLKAAENLRNTATVLQSEHTSRNPKPTISGLYHTNIKKASPFGSTGMEIAIRPSARDKYGSTAQTAGIVAGVAATALGAGYLYHRHQERKKAPEDRVAFYNKLLPPTFSTPPLPYARVSKETKVPTNALTEEIALAGKKFPSGIDAGFKRRKVVSRPPERDKESYTPNMSTGLTGVRLGGEKGGKAQLIFANRSQKIHRLPGKERGRFKATIMGRELPISIGIGKREVVKLKTANPNALTARQRDDLVWAYGAPLSDKDLEAWKVLKTKSPLDMTAGEHKQFEGLKIQGFTQDARDVTHSMGPQQRARLEDAFTDPEVVSRVFNQRGKAAATKEEKKQKQRDVTASDQTLEDIGLQKQREKRIRQMPVHHT